MNNRVFKSNKEELIAEGQRIVSVSEDAEFVRKVTMINLMLNGMSASCLSKACPETSRTLSAWMKAVDEQGFEALVPKKQPGRPSRLSDVEKEEIKDVIVSDPQVYGYNVWDGPSLSDFISKKYGVKLGVRQCQRLFHELGFSLIRPQKFPSKNEENAPARDEFKKN